MKRNSLLLSARKYIFAVLAIIAGFSILGYSWISYEFNTIKGKTLDSLPRHMLWAHGGYTQGFQYNSLESFDAARRMGYYGIELDIHFIEGRGFIVTHDLPVKTNDSGNALFLNTVFERYKDAFYYWLDFKNLDGKNARDSGKLLSEYMAANGLEGRLFIESRKAGALRELKAAAPGINTIYWLNGKNFRRVCGLFKEKCYTVLSGADTVSLPVEYADDIFFENFSHLNTAVFTVNNAAQIEHLFARGARIVLPDLDMKVKFPEAYRPSPHGIARP